MIEQFGTVATINVTDFIEDLLYSFPDKESRILDYAEKMCNIFTIENRIEYGLKEIEADSFFDWFDINIVGDNET